MKKISKYILIFMLVFWLNACVFVLNNNFGSDIHTTKRVDDLGIAQKYDTEITGNKRR